MLTSILGVLPFSRRHIIHLAIDAVGAKLGGQTGLLGVIDAALQDKRINKVTLFTSPGEKRLLDFPTSEKLIEVAFPLIDRHYALRIFWYEWLLGYHCRKVGAHVLLAANSYGRGCSFVPHVTFVRQALPFSPEAIAAFNSGLRRIKIRALRWQMGRSCRNAKSVVAQNDILNEDLISAFSLAPGSVFTIYSPPKRLMPPKGCSKWEENNNSSQNCVRLLYVGSDAPYKKTDTAVKGMKFIRKSFLGAELAMTLPTNHHYASTPGITLLGYLNDELLSLLYLSSDVLVLPSLIETSGQSSFEAMSLGVPVLIADRPYAHDTCQDAALFFDPLSPQDFAEKAIRLLTDTDLRQTLVEKGLKLVENRRAGQPYKKIIDIVVKCAYAHKTKAI